MARRTKEEAEQTRNNLIDAAEKLFSEQGVAHTTLNDIAREAGVTRGAVYWHFRNKNELFEAMHQRVTLPFEQLLALLEDHPEGCPLHELEQICVRVLLDVAADARRQQVLTILFIKCEYTEEMRPAQERLIELCRPIGERLATLFEKAHAAGMLQEGVDPRCAASGLMLYLHGILSGWVFDPDRFPMAEEAQDLLALFLRNIIAPRK